MMPIRSIWTWFSSIVTVAAAITTVWAFFSPGTVIDVLRRIEDSTASLPNISAKIDILKKEVSDDPIKEIVNRGYKPSKQWIMSALDNNDSKGVVLFCSTSIVDKKLFRNVILRITDVRYNHLEDTLQALRVCREDIIAGGCREFREDFLQNAAESEGFIRENDDRFCG